MRKKEIKPHLKQMRNSPLYNKISNKSKLKSNFKLPNRK